MLRMMIALALVASGASAADSCAPGAFWNASMSACAACPNSTATLPSTGSMIYKTVDASDLTKITFPEEGKEAIPAQVQKCWDYCTAEPSCAAWVYNPSKCGESISPPQCYLKSSPGEFSDSACRYAGQQARSVSVPSSFSYGGSTSCAACAANATLVSASAGCVPTSQLWAGPVDTVFFFSGTSTEGAGAFAVTKPEGISFVTDHLGTVGGAMSMTAGTTLVTAQLSALPTSGADRTISVWMRCPAPDAESEGVGLFFFSDGSAPSLSSAKLLLLSNLTGKGAFAPVCTDCYRSTVKTLAGNGTRGFADGYGTSAMFSNTDQPCDPMGMMAQDSTGLLYASDSPNGRVRTIRITDGLASTLAGRSPRNSSDGVGTSASFYCPEGMGFSRTGGVVDETILYVTDGPWLIRKIVVGSGAVTTIAGQYNVTGFIDATGTNALFSLPTSITSDNLGSLYICDTADNGAIRKMTLPDYVVTTFLVVSPCAGVCKMRGFIALVLDELAQNFYGSYNFDPERWGIYKIRVSDATMTKLGTFRGPGSLALRGSSLLFNDWAVYKIYALDLQTLDVTVIAGGGFDGAGEAAATNGYADGAGSQALFDTTIGTSILANNDYVVADGGNGVIRQITWPMGPPNSVDTRLVLPGVCAGDGRRWTHVAASFSGTSLALFVDGAPAGLAQISSLANLSTSALQLGGLLAPVGRFSATPSAAFSGAVSDLRVFGRVLTGLEIEALTQVPAGVLPSIPGRTMTTVPGVVHSWLCPAGFTGPVIELRLSAATNGWVWTRSPSSSCADAVGSISAAVLSPGASAGIAVLVLLLAGMVLYVVLTRLRMQRKFQALASKTTLASRAMDRARLLALQATP